MSVIEYLSDLALSPLRGASAAAALDLLRDPASARTERLLDLLGRAQECAWQALGLALAGTAWWQQVRDSLDERDKHDLDELVLIFLQATPLPELAGRTHFRGVCLGELRQARRSSWLTSGAPDPSPLRQRLAARLQRPEEGSDWQTLEGLAEELERRGCGGLAWLLRHGTGTLLALFVCYFFRRAADADADLAADFVFEDIGGPGPAQAAGLAALREALRAHGRRLKQLLDGTPPQPAVPLEPGEAHFQAYHAALAGRRFDDALAELRQALASDPQRFAPFPPDAFAPQRILAADEYGVTFLCLSETLGKIAVKALTPQGAAGRRAIAEAFRQAITLSQTHHPAILPLRRWGYADDGQNRPYAASDFFDAPTLEEYVRERGPLHLEDFLELARRLAEALRTAHARGVLHGDVRPGCVLLRRTAEGWQVRLTDFGPALDPSATAEEAVAADVRGFGRTCCWALLGAPTPAPVQWQQVSPSLAALLRDCRAEDVHERPPDFAAVLERLARLRLLAERAPRLVVLRGWRPGAEYLLRAGPSIVGRGGNVPVDVDLDDQEPHDSVLSSRRHALLSWRQGQLTVTDLHSANGTFVNRARLPAGHEYPLHDQDILQIGSVHLRVVW
jgi:tetratricopeptide (TPR) repeat protein